MGTLFDIYELKIKENIDYLLDFNSENHNKVIIFKITINGVSPPLRILRGEKLEVP